MNPQDPQSELHDALLEMGFANKPGSTKGRMFSQRYYLPELEQYIKTYAQAHQQQLLTDLLGEAVTIAQDRMYEVVVAEDGTSEERLGKEFIHAVPVSFLEHKKQELEGGVNG